MSGKGQLIQFLNSHPKIVIFPFHKFGISYDINKFINFFNKNGKYNFKDEYTFLVVEKKINFYKHIGLSDLITFMISSHSSFPELIKSNYEKLCTAYAGDDFTQKVKFDFSLDKFFKLLRFYQKKNLNNQITFEELEDIIFASFIKSVKQYSKFNFKNNYFALFAGNGIDHLEDLHKYFKNYKFIFVNRNILNRLLSNIKRHEINKKRRLDSSIMFEKIIRNLPNYHLNKNLVTSQLTNLSTKTNKIKIIDFEELIKDRKKTLLNINSFLKLKYSKQMLLPSFVNSRVYLHKANKIVENDKLQNYLQDRELKKIKFLQKSIILLQLYSFYIRLYRRLSLLFR